jgi:hypothetical protein
LANHLGQISSKLCAACTGLLGQLCQPQRFHLECMGTALAFGRFAAGLHQSLRRIRIGRFGSYQGRARLLANKRLGAQLLFKIFNFLRACQQTGLLRIRGVKAHAMGGHRVTLLDKQGVTRLKLATQGQRFFHTLRHKSTLQPVHQHRFEARVVHTQQV